MEDLKIRHRAIAFLNGHRDLLHVQTRWAHGLVARKQAYDRAVSLGVREYEQAVGVHRSEFEKRRLALTESQRSAWDSATLAWDEKVDLALGNAERLVLENLQREREELRGITLAHRQSKTQLEKSHLEQRQALQSKHQKVRQGLVKNRDGSLAKLDGQRSALENSLHEAREWIGLRTGSPTLMNWQASLDAAMTSESNDATTLDGVSRLGEQISSWESEVLRLHAHPATRLVSLPILLLVGATAAAGAAGMAYAMATPPLIWGVSALVAAFLVPAVVAFFASWVLARNLKRLFPPLVEREASLSRELKRARGSVELHFRQSLSELDLRQKQEGVEIASMQEQQLLELERKVSEQRASVSSNARVARQGQAEERAESMVAINTVEGSKLQKLHQSHTQESRELQQAENHAMAGIRDNFERAQYRASQRWRQGRDYLQQQVDQLRAFLDSQYPDWASLAADPAREHRNSSNLAWPIGQVQIALPAHGACDGDGGTASQGETASLPALPLLFDLMNHGALVLRPEPGGSDSAIRLTRHLMLRALSSLPAGALQTTILDPEGLGKQFSWIMQLADVDPSLVGHRVWTQPVHIADQLEMLSRHVEDVIQQCLRNRFRNLQEYNAHAGPMMIPYRLVVWAGFPLGLDEHSWQSLIALLTSGGKCGVGLVLQLAENCRWPNFVDLELLAAHGLSVQVFPDRASEAMAASHREEAGGRNPSEGRARLFFPGIEKEGWAVELAAAPTSRETQEVMQNQLLASEEVGRKVVPFATIDEAIASDSEAGTAQGIEIPIGISDSGRILSLDLGRGTAQHALIAGKTGSGKSSLLHTMITSAVTRYSPGQLRLVLLDFKKGVEFQVYAESALSHVDILGIESRREFGLSTLEYLDRILSARGEAFRNWGVQDLPSLIQQHPAETLPRVLVVIDEFQELFVEDDKLSQQAALLLDRLVRQGRSFGIHLVLASQTLGGAYSLPRTTLAQMAVRIALQCDASDAMLILNEANTAAERLRHSGQAIYNSAGGRLEGNQRFQVAFLEKLEQRTRLEKLPKCPVPHRPEINPLGRRVLFEGHKPSMWDAVLARASVSNGRAAGGGSLPWILGESVSIDPPVVRSFARTSGRNALIVGADEGVVASLWTAWIRSVEVSGGFHGENVSEFWILDGTRLEEPQTRRAVDELAARGWPVRTAGVRELDEYLSALDTELERRLRNPGESASPFAWIVLNLGRFRELRRNDDYSFGASSEGAKSPDALLARLLSEGPSVGMHGCLWVESVSTLQRWLSRASLRDLEIRILQPMSAGDSNQLIDSAGASRLEPHVLLIHDDADGRSVKFRPFLLSSLLQPP